MGIKYANANVRTCFATCSVSCESDNEALPDKLAAIRGAGFDAIELSMPDIVAYAKALNGVEPDPKDFDTLAEVAGIIGAFTRQLGLRILMLQPFANFEGWTKGQFDAERRDAFERARGWMRIMEAAGTDMLQVGSSDAEGISSSFDDLAADLAELADMCAEKGFRVAYENWCWATHAPTWKTVWQIVEKADRPNLGLCLDTFQTAGGEFGDPTTWSGLIEREPGDDGEKGAIAKAELESRWMDSLADLAVTVPPEKIFLLQISDAYNVHPPMENVTDAQGQRPRYRWSNSYRPLPCGRGYLPVQDVLRAVLGTGFRGWLSVEVFDPRGQSEFDTMGGYTKAAMESLKKLLLLALN